MHTLRRWLALLLILVLAAPAWSGSGHCAGDSGHGGSAAAQVVDVDHAALAPSDGGGHDQDASRSASPCCSAVLPASTCGTVAHGMPVQSFPALSARFVSAEHQPLRRPPRPAFA